MTDCIRLQLGRYFKLKERKSNFLNELRAGTVTFLTVRFS
jgi:xanthine/uracil/vitamin C permease (AzgA family)